MPVCAHLFHSGKSSKRSSWKWVNGDELTGDLEFTINVTPTCNFETDIVMYEVRKDGESSADLILRLLLRIEGTFERVYHTI